MSPSSFKFRPRLFWKVPKDQQQGRTRRSISRIHDYHGDK